MELPTVKMIQDSETAGESKWETCTSLCSDRCDLTYLPPYQWVKNILRTSSCPNFSPHAGHLRCLLRRFSSMHSLQKRWKQRVIAALLNRSLQTEQRNMPRAMSSISRSSCPLAVLPPLLPLLLLLLLAPTVLLLLLLLTAFFMATFNFESSLCCSILNTLKEWLLATITSSSNRRSYSTYWKHLRWNTYIHE